MYNKYWLLEQLIILKKREIKSIDLQILFLYNHCTMNKIYVDDIISIVRFIIKKDPYDTLHLEACWQFRKTTDVENLTKENLKVQHAWRVESNADADAIITSCMIDDKTKPEIDLNKVVFLVLELC